MDTTRMKTGQGATEYLVLLAVALVIALVGIALLGFFPGTASDAQVAESQIYWQSASPIAITEMAAKVITWDNARTAPYLRIRNNGQYPIRITKVLGDGQSITQLYAGGTTDMGQFYYIAPGEERYFADSAIWAVPTDRIFQIFMKSSGSTVHWLMAASSICSPPNSSNYGTLVVKDFGFEYIQYVEGQQITKREIGKSLVIRCS